MYPPGAFWNLKTETLQLPEEPLPKDGTLCTLRVDGTFIMQAPPDWTFKEPMVFEEEEEEEVQEEKEKELAQDEEPLPEYPYVNPSEMKVEPDIQ